MEKLALLQKYHNMACHNLFCYSRNYAMTEPKIGFEEKWKAAGEEVRLLEEMLIEERSFTSEKLTGTKIVSTIKKEAARSSYQEENIRNISKNEIEMFLMEWCNYNFICTAELERLFSTVISKKKVRGSVFLTIL